MAYSRAEKERDWQKIIDKFFDNKRGFSLLTTEDIKSVIKDKEIRLLNYFDSEQSMPAPLRNNKIMLFPRTTDSWWLVKCDGFMELPAIGAQTVDFKSELPFKLLSASAGMGEQQYLLNMINSGILQDFLKLKDTFYFSIMGKQRSKPFSFSINGNKIDVVNPTIEIDAGLEGKGFVVVIEAKAKIIEKFNLRQLYFPYMHCKIMTKKEVVPVFFCWDPKTGTYNLWKFKFEDDNINKLKFVESTRYKLIQ